ncbi:hypothetical protein K456DRAFT_43758 [Colletotrichum gloeosporioides 23]|nr:hypothetical protein K456DRAFT_43758 [Colletotrichum gloeosporioides 23]
MLRLRCREKVGMKWAVSGGVMVGVRSRTPRSRRYSAAIEAKHNAWVLVNSRAAVKMALFAVEQQWSARNNEGVAAGSGHDLSLKSKAVTESDKLQVQLGSLRHMLTVSRDLLQVGREKDCAPADGALELGQQPLHVKPWSSYPSWVGKQQRRHLYLVLRNGRRGGNG